VTDGSEGDDDVMLLDDHSHWSDLPEGQKAAITARLRQIRETAAEACGNDKTQGWGSVPHRIIKRIIDSLSPKVDWREELRAWTGSQNCRLEKSSTFKRINNRFPYMQPGKRRSRGLRVAAFCDQSGSMSDAALRLVCAEISGIVEIANVTFVPFDCAIDEENIVVFEAGSVPAFARTASGGTDFNAPTDWLNSDEHRDEFDVAWIMTDGYAPKPGECVVPRCWLIEPLGKLLFETEEKVIVITDDKDASLSKAR
jgi:predicted metal-dependent peptidase